MTSNLLLPLLESYCSRCLVYPGKFLTLKRMKLRRKQQILNLRDVLFSMCSGRSVVIASLRRYILYDKMESSSFASHPYRFGRFLYTTLLAQVCMIDRHHSLESLNTCIVREILPELTNQIIFLISGDEFEQREVPFISNTLLKPLLTLFQTAGRTMAELCRKFGEKILSDMVPIFKGKSTSMDSRTREGVCLALSAMMQVLCTSHFLSLTYDQREHH